jgi:hypothetical protein
VKVCGERVNIEEPENLDETHEGERAAVVHRVDADMAVRTEPSADLAVK